MTSLKVKVIDVKKTGNVFHLTEDEIHDLLRRDFQKHNIDCLDAFIHVMKHRGPFDLLKDEGSRITPEIYARLILRFDNMIPIVEFAQAQKLFIKVRIPRSGKSITPYGQDRGVSEGSLVNFGGIAMINLAPWKILRELTDIWILNDSTSYTTVKNWPPHWQLPIDGSKSALGKLLSTKGVKVITIDREHAGDIIKKCHIQLQSALDFVLGSGQKLAFLDYTPSPPIELKAPMFTVNIKEVAKKENLHALLTGIDKTGAYKPSYLPYILSGLYDVLRTGPRRLTLILDVLNTGNPTSLKKIVSEISLSKEDTQRVLQEVRERIEKRLQVIKIIEAIERKLGIKLIRKLRKVIEYGQPDKILNALSKEDRSIVQLDIKRVDDAEKRIIANTCKHKSALKALDFARTRDDQIIALQTLKSFILKQVDTSMITCNVCKQELICPHRLLKYQMEIDRKPFGDVKTALQKFASRRVTKDDIFVTYCMICSEYISQSLPGEQETEYIGVGEQEIDEFRSLIAGEIYKFFSGVQFKILVSVSYLVRYGIRSTLPFMSTLDTEIVKSKRKNVSMDDIRVKLYMVILVHAYILRIVTADEFNGQILIPGKKVNVHSISYVYDKLMHSARPLLLDLQDISPEFIMNKLKQYYLMMKANVVTKNLAITDKDTKTDIVRRLVGVDPIYDLSRLAAIIYKKLPLVFKDTPESARREFELVVGQTPNEISSKARKTGKAGIYDKLFWPKDSKNTPFLTFTTGHGVDFAHMKTWIGGFIGGRELTNKIVKLQKYEITPEVHLSYFKETYDLIMEYIHLDRDDPKAVAHFQERLSKARDAEAQVRLASTSGKSFFDLKFSGPRSPRPDVPITYVFDEQGRKHHWHMYKFKGKDGFYLKSQVSKDVELSYNGIEDIKCTICDVTWSKVGSLNANKVKKAIKIASLVSKLIAYYQIMCPEGTQSDPFHSITGGKCARCGFSDKMTSDEQRAFTEKYESTLKNKVSVLEPPSPPTKKDTRSEWKYDHKNALTFAEFAGVSVNAVEYIGMSQGVHYDDLTSGKIEIRPPETFGDHRFLVVDAAIREIFVSYSTLKNLSKITKMPSAYEELFKESGTPTSVIPQLHKALPDISSPFYKEYAIVRTTHTPENVILFMREFLCKIILDISKMKVEGAPDLMTAFAKFVSKKLFDAEKFISKRDTVIILEVEDVSEEVVLDKKFDPFSYETQDYDGNQDENM